MKTETSHPAPVCAPAVVDHGIVHDLLNPLTAILGNLDLLGDLLGESAPGAVLRRINEGQVSAADLRDMLENLRYLMSPDLQASIPTTAVDLGAVVERLPRGATQELRIALPAHRRHMARGNEELLRRAAEALLRTTTRIGLRSALEVECPNGFAVEVRFAHYDRTLPAALADRLFEPDFAQIQLEHGLKIDRARGLWFASTVAKAHGGSLRYESRPNGGSFVMHIPVERSRET